MYADPTPWFKDKALEACQKALELGPDLAESHASCGLAMLVSERYKDAEKHLNQAIKLNPRLYEAYYYYGRTRFHQGDLEGAATWFAKAASVNPADYQARMLRVQILRGLGRESEATPEAVEAVNIVKTHLEWHPDDVRALHLGAGSLILLGDVERAERPPVQRPVLDEVVGSRRPAGAYRPARADRGLLQFRRSDGIR